LSPTTVARVIREQTTARPADQAAAKTSYRQPRFGTSWRRLFGTGLLPVRPTSNRLFFPNRHESETSKRHHLGRSRLGFSSHGVHDVGGLRSLRTTGLCGTLPCRNNDCWCCRLSSFKTASSLSLPTGERRRLSERQRWYLLSGAFLWVVVVSWLTRGGPWLPRLVGTAVVFVFIVPLMLGRRS